MVNVDNRFSLSSAVADSEVRINGGINSARSNKCTREDKSEAKAEINHMLRALVDLPRTIMDNFVRQCVYLYYLCYEDINVFTQ